MPPPVPPRVKLGRMTAGRPVRASAARASSSECAMALRRRFDADRGHGVAEFQPVLGAFDHLGAGADQFDVVACQRAGSRELHRGVERGLAAHGRQQRIGFFARDDAFDDLRRDRLDVGGVGEAGIGHDGGGIGVHQHDAIALGLQRLARLRAGIVELAGLADDDRAGADDQDGVDVGAFGHGYVQYSSVMARGTVGEAGFASWRRSSLVPAFACGGPWTTWRRSTRCFDALRVSVPDASGIAARLPAGGSARGSGLRAGMRQRRRRRLVVDRLTGERLGTARSPPRCSAR